MSILILPNPSAVAHMAAEAVAQAIRRKPDLRLGLAAGTSPLGLYAALIERHRSGKLDCSRLRVFSLDEFLGLPDDHSHRFGRFLRQHLLDHLNVPESSITLLDSPQNRDAWEVARTYEAVIRDAGGIDVQILGMGMNGHLGFNEPGSSLASRTRPVRLAEETIAQQQKTFGSDPVPRWALTMGIGTILQARSLLLLATGAGKARVVAQALEGPVTASLPASALQLHPAVTVFLDEDAASDLARHHYYRQATPEPWPPLW